MKIHSKRNIEDISVWSLYQGKINKNMEMKFESDRLRVSMLFYYETHSSMYQLLLYYRFGKTIMSTLRCVHFLSIGFGDMKLRILKEFRIPLFYKIFCRTFTMYRWLNNLSKESIFWVLTSSAPIHLRIDFLNLIFSWKSQSFLYS